MGLAAISAGASGRGGKSAASRLEQEQGCRHRGASGRSTLETRRHGGSEIGVRAGAQTRSGEQGPARGIAAPAAVKRGGFFVPDDMPSWTGISVDKCE